MVPRRESISIRSTLCHSSTTDPVWIFERRFLKKILNVVLRLNIIFNALSLSDQRKTLPKVFFSARSIYNLISAVFSAATSSNLGMWLWWEALDESKGTTCVFAYTMVTKISPNFPTTLL